MRVVARPALTRFWKPYPTDEKPLKVCFDRARQHDFSSFADLEAVLGSDDHVDNFTIFDIGGNKCRIIARVLYKLG